jgi:4-amino-4-deoxy-L-arabinose transferase-like glycosyltransferase
LVSPPFRPPQSPYAKYQEPPHPGWLFALVIAAWIFPGLLSHDPWKPDEAENFGIVYHMVRTGEWLVPTLAGEPVLEKPPLYYVVAAAFAWFFSPLLPLHDGARLATGFFMALTFLFVGLTGRELYGRGYGWVSALSLVGCFGLIIRGHQIIADVALLAGAAAAFYGLAMGLRRPGAGGAFFGTGVGVAFLSEGLLAPLLSAAVVACAAAASPLWRSRNVAICLALGLAFALPWLIAWPYLLYRHSPALFSLWLSADLGRFPGLASLTLDSASFYVRALPWFAWPALPLAAWALWHEGRSGFRHPGVHLPAVAFLVMLVGASLSTSARDVEGLPLLIPLALLASAGIYTLRRGAANSLYWFAVLGFSVLALVAWFYWLPLALEVPERLFRHLDRMRPGYTFGFRPIPFLIGLGYTVAWVALLAVLRKNAERPLLAWCGGLTLVWSLMMSLLIGYIDHAKTYRAVVSSLRAALPVNPPCLDSLNLGKAQRAMLEYFADIVTRPVPAGSESSCTWLLVQGDPRQWTDPTGEWEKVWEGRRPRDKNELWVLYKKKPPESAKGARRLAAVTAAFPERRLRKRAAWSRPLRARRGRGSKEPRGPPARAA